MMRLSSHPLMSLADQKDVFLHDLQSSPPLSGLKAELSHWEHLIFSFDKDTSSGEAMNPYNNNSGNNNRGGRRSRPSGSGQSSNTGPTPEEALLLAQLSSNRASPPPFSDASYAALMQSLSQHNSNPYGSSNMMSHNFDSQLPGVDQLMSTIAGPSWSALPPPIGHHQQQSQHHHHNQPPGPPLYGAHGPQFSSPSTSFTPTMSPPSGGAAAPSAGSSSSAGSPEALDDAAEEKRRRNTAASARFRIKKKQKTLNLERSVADLTGRAEELEKEAADLRRENGWLREIVTMKSTRMQQLREAHAGPSTEAGGSADAGLPPTGNVVHIEPYDSAGEESSSDEEGRRRKGKGKATKPPTKKSSK
ncbi:hypothetical protein K523DRAFT_416544 [Schizophyllum commune Tattone D]|nr:hypothetical protein K523DRAFT_416544 [Schizophyllum commune Tattone D]